MRRAVLSSVLIIGAALAVVFSGGAFSAFSDEETINGTATAAIVDFELSGDGTDTGGTTEATSTDTLTIDFDGQDDLCPAGAQAYFAPGDSCTIEVNLTRDTTTIAQQLAVILSVSSFTVSGGTDLNIADPTVYAIDCDTGEPGAHAGADWTISYTFVDADAVGDDDVAYMPAATNDPGQQIHITVALHADAAGNAGSGCQGDSVGTIALTILASQDTANSHNTADDVSPAP